MRSACQWLSTLVLFVSSGALLSNLWSASQLSSDVGEYRPPRQNVDSSLPKAASRAVAAEVSSTQASLAAASSVIRVAVLFKVHSLVRTPLHWQLYDYVFKYRDSNSCLSTFLFLYGLLASST